MSSTLNFILKIFLFFFDDAFIFFILLPYYVKKLLNYINGFSLFFDDPYKFNRFSFFIFLTKIVL